MSVWIVLLLDYGDNASSIKGVFSSQEAADKFTRTYPADRGYWAIENHILDAWKEEKP